VAWIEEAKEQGLRVLYKVDPLTGQRTRWTAGLPDGSYTVSPTEDYLIITASEEGPKEDPGVFEVTEMDGFRVTGIRAEKRTEPAEEPETDGQEAEAAES
jgi:hypothetical protein